MKINVKKLNDAASLPHHGSEDAAGYDLYSINEQPCTILPGETEIFDTGLAFEFPQGTFGAVVSRSGLSIKRGVRVENCIGIIDADYRGPVKVALHNDSQEPQVIDPRERIAQLILMPFIPMDFNEVSELNTTDRGEGGFGSTGKN